MLDPLAKKSSILSPNSTRLDNRSKIGSMTENESLFGTAAALTLSLVGC
jgi:hypothetical protein